MKMTINWPIVVLLSVLMICVTTLAAIRVLPLEVLTHGLAMLFGLLVPSEAIATKTIYVGDRRGMSAQPPPPTSPPPKIPPFTSAAILMGLVLGASATAACARVWSPQDAQLVADDTAAQLACVQDASTREEGERCQCAVRDRYPGPRCDGGYDGGR